MASGNRPSSKVSTDTSTAAAQDEDCLAWLQYPTDDVFERSYCSDLFQGEWALTEGRLAFQSNSDVFTHQHEGSVSRSLETSVCLTDSCQPSISPVGKHVGTRAALTSRPLSKIDVEGALAQGAARAAGYSWPVGQNSFNKIRTLMQPGDANLPLTVSGKTLSSSKQFTRSTVKLNSPLSPVPASMPNALQNAKCPNVNMVKSPPLNKVKQATSESAVFSSKRSRTEYESQSESSRITETCTVRRGKEALVADSRKWASTSHSGASQISTSLSESGTADCEKLKQEYFELLLDDLTEDDSTDTKKSSRLPSKRNRIPEVHNLSERIRRNKINEKLKALQDLVPNSSKTDKASVLDEAIEYMKALQMQLQMVSMRDNSNVSAMMMPTSFPPQMHLPIAQPQSIGIGVPIGHAGMGMSVGVMPETRLPIAATLYQCPTAMMSQMHAMPYNSQNLAGFAHMGFPQNAQMLPTIANTQERPTSMHRHQDFDKGWLHQQSCNLENETASIEEQDDFSD